MNIRKSIVSLFLSVPIIALSYPANSNVNTNNGSANSKNGTPQLAAGCAAPTGITFLDLNNVKCRIETGGSLWEDRSTGTADYEVPKGSKNHSIFAGGIWVGGLDVNGQLKLAAVLYRQNGNDFWPGPLNIQTAEIDAQTCRDWDKFFKITRAEVDEFVAWYACTQDPDCDEATEYAGYTIPSSILNWPAHGDVSKGQDFYLAPFFDYDGDGVYNPYNGDYPKYDLKGEIDCRKVRDIRLFGDETYWWIYNDKGNVHTETGAPSIGMEFHAQAFAFSTSDEVNNMTFYNYQTINRSTFTLTNTFFGIYADTDLGCANDDYVGCDVQRGFGYCYNGDNFDESCFGEPGYGAQPPAIGIDFFEGPYQDNDGKDNPLTTDVQKALQEGGIPYEGLGLGYGDSIIDNERMGMFMFVYFNRPDLAPNPAMSDPTSATQFYNYLRGLWKDGTPMVYGGNAHYSDPKATNIVTTYMFPGDSDPLHWGTQGVDPGFIWSEQTEQNPVGDRRFIQSAGPFTLLPGEFNDITIGVVWARASGGDPFESVELARVADDKAQSLFDNCFKLLDGPDAPDLTIQELDRELILYISNPTISNNYNEEYAEVDPFIALPDNVTNGLTEDQIKELKTYRFQGYQIFQVKNADVSVSDLDNPDLARLVAQCDIKDGISRIINFEFNEDLGVDEPVEKVDGADEGIVHSFRITEDQFAQGDKRLINYKTYYYIAIAYAYNNYKTYNPLDPLALDGQKKPYLASRKAAVGSIRSYSGIPHKPTSENGGTIQSSNYGDTPEITRVEGTGNGGNILDLTSKSENEIITNYKVSKITYKKNAGPVKVKVIDPLSVPGGNFTIEFLDSTGTDLSDAYWRIYSSDKPGDTIYSEKNIQVQNEQLILKWGISVTIGPVSEPGSDPEGENGFISATIEYRDSSKQWLSGVPDIDGATPQNWIRAGTAEFQDQPEFNDFTVTKDDNQSYEKLLNGTWAPYALTAASSGKAVNQPAYSAATTNSSSPFASKLKHLQSVDIVITSDKSKWTRCVVLETGEDPTLSEGNAQRLALRKSPSVDKDGNPDNSGTIGMGWFPGYAIDVENGERLNMAFGEDSWMAGENGRDMIWNPTSTLTTELGEIRWGGKHYIYIFRDRTQDPEWPSAFDPMPAYDEGKFIYDKYTNGSSKDIERSVWGACIWVGIPLLKEGHSLLESDVRIRLRVEKPYNKYETGEYLNSSRPLYSFNLDELKARTNELTAAESALDMINIVPNPYYSYSNYELTQLDNLVKIINLPEECTIRIYNINGSLIREFKKSDPLTYVNWDLKNNAGIPIAGGLYIIHINVPGVGEKIIKWFGVLRPIDLKNF